MGALLAQNPIWVSAARWAGAIYLFYLGGQMVVQAVQEASRKSGLGVVLVPRTAAHAVRLALGFALLNPHVYLDTVGLMGAASARYAAPARMLFVAGAAAASLLWFNFLVVVGVLVSKWLESPSVRRWFDCGVGLILFGSAIWLICS